MANSLDGKRPKPESLPVRIRSSTRAWPRWRSSKQLHRAVAAWGVGDEDLVDPGIEYPATVEHSSRPVSAACAQATSRAWARATRRRVSASSSSAASTRHAVGSDATEPNRSTWLRNTARSEMASPPSASITARSSATRPGSCPECRCRNDTNASDIAADKPVASARSTNSRAPAWPTTPRPFAVTTILGREEVRFILRVPFDWTTGTLDKSHRPR